MGENKIPTLKINGTPIERKRQANVLGSFIIEHMDWNTHIFNITKTITKTLGVMNRSNIIFRREYCKYFTTL